MNTLPPPPSVEVDLTDNTVHAEFLRAARSAPLAAVQDALRAGAAPGAVTSEGETALLLAAFFNPDPAVIPFLLEQGLSIDVRDTRGTTPLHLFARGGRDDLLVRALDAGLDINVAAESGATSLLLAAVHDHPTTARLLLEHGARHTCADTSGATALHRARSHVVVDLLIAAGAELERGNESGITPLGLAARNGRASVCATLLAHGANVHARSSEGNTALIATRDAATALVLLAAGADPLAMNVKGVSFEQRATKSTELGAAYASWRARQAMQAVLHPARPPSSPATIV